MSAPAWRRTGRPGAEAVPAPLGADADRLRGSVALLTGATGGMGRVMAVELARQGATVVTIARDRGRAAELTRTVARVAGPGALVVIEGDLTRRGDVLAAARRIADEHPAVHLLINNAGAHERQRRAPRARRHRHRGQPRPTGSDAAAGPHPAQPAQP